MRTKLILPLCTLDLSWKGRNKIGGFVVQGILRFTYVASPLQTCTTKVLISHENPKAWTAFYPVAKIIRHGYCTKFITAHYGTHPFCGLFLAIFSYLYSRMMHSEEHIDRLKRAIIERFGRTLDSPTDYDMLSADIKQCTGETISSATLKRLFGYLKPSTAPRPSTLSVLARYVGCTGWSDFCRMRQEVSIEESASLRRSPFIRRVAIGAGIFFVLVIVAILVVTKPKEPIASSHIQYIHDTVYVERMIEIEDTISRSLTDEHQRYELALRYCLGEAKRQCDAVRAHRSQMDILTYKSFVDSAYFAIVFDYMDNVIKQRVSNDFYGDSLLIMRYGNDIFAQCRDACIELMREIPVDELTAAQNARQ